MWMKWKNYWLSFCNHARKEGWWNYKVFWEYNWWVIPSYASWLIWNESLSIRICLGMFWIWRLWCKTRWSERQILVNRTIIPPVQWSLFQCCTTWNIFQCWREDVLELCKSTARRNQSLWKKAKRNRTGVKNIVWCWYECHYNLWTCERKFHK